MVNHVQISGVLAEEPEVRTSQQGTRYITNFTINVTSKRRGEDVEMPINVTIFGDLVDKCETLSKGQPLMVMGRVNLDTWVYKDKEYSKVQIIASDVVMLLNSDGASDIPF